MTSPNRKVSPVRKHGGAGGGGGGGGGAMAASSTAGGATTSTGSYRITRAEVEQAFAFFDKSGTGVLRPRDLKARLAAFYPRADNKECRFLISEPNFTVDKLWALLENNTVTNFDPVREAFRVYDPHGTGFVCTEKLKEIMKNLGYGSELTADDLEVLIRTADVDGDGKVSLEDFRNMLNQPKA